MSPLVAGARKHSNNHNDLIINVVFALRDNIVLYRNKTFVQQSHTSIWRNRMSGMRNLWKLIAFIGNDKTNYHR